MIVTLAPPALRLLPFASVAVTVRSCVLLPSAVMVALAGVSVDCVASAAPAVPVALKVTGEPARPMRVAVRVLAPALVPKVQLPTVAMPEALVAGVRSVAKPPPLVTAKVTLTPLTGWL